jgi:hypothetical protein
MNSAMVDSDVKVRFLEFQAEIGRPNGSKWPYWCPQLKSNRISAIKKPELEKQIKVFDLFWVGCNISTGRVRKSRIRANCNETDQTQLQNSSKLSVDQSLMGSQTICRFKLELQLSKQVQFLSTRISIFTRAQNFWAKPKQIKPDRQNVPIVSKMRYLNEKTLHFFSNSS